MEYFDDEYILNEWAKKRLIDRLKKKNRPQRKSVRAYSEIPSGDDNCSISSCTSRYPSNTSSNPSANIQQKTECAKNNIKKFKNNDFSIDYSAGYNAIVRRLRRLLSLDYKGGSNYADYLTPKGIFSFRLSNHNANGNNFTSGNINISVFVAYHKYDVPTSNVNYTEFEISKEYFSKNPQSVVVAIIDAIDRVLNGGDFSLPSNIAEPKIYPQPTGQTKTENNIKENKQYTHMRKNVIRLNESQLRQVVKESVKKVLKENDSSYEKYEKYKKDFLDFKEFLNSDLFRGQLDKIKTQGDVLEAAALVLSYFYTEYYPGSVYKDNAMLAHKILSGFSDLAYEDFEREDPYQAKTDRQIQYLMKQGYSEDEAWDIINDEACRDDY